MYKNSVIASGTIRRPLGPIDDSTWFETALERVSKTSCILPGTSAVMCTRTASPMPITSTPATREAMTSYLLTVRPKSLIVGELPTVIEPAPASKPRPLT